ncbi:DNA repair protein RecO [Curvibacter sp. CHRR-16]|uniref:DNA repair protein RecO n=1 Tax=Curvibacter sp. CHRR-16 TaxID=2835872 RepID=UPI001BDA26EA|nr:DNA repair protein RecO [Curvibacter sp. CHRR-16]MBT0571352.1 DNA repair protein RecO [Curvibacter sp. CHRR-16]
MAGARSTYRVADESAFVLHRYDWSETSLILETFTRQHGRVALVAKGAKRPTSSFRAVLLLLQPITITYGGDAEIRTLKSAEWQGGHVMPRGDALLAGCYLNELLLTLLARDDPHTLLYDDYARVVQLLAQGDSRLLQPVLRGFELLLLHRLGLLPQLHEQTHTLAPIEPDMPYTLVPEGGLREATEHDAHAMLGAHWLALQTAFNAPDAWLATLTACTDMPSALKPLLRHCLHYHCGVRQLRTRQVMRELHAL